ncbi:hypothetical protein [Caulobacter sp. FWC2]|uniref:hypothetical protein n=1 Tax=Caulobacter sp. FWC2 TaxID=69664 RepID=UPI000C148159|nr:hypothetical protein [Caulobacter sp. FWC2]PIB93965.1 hypothetical protein CSW62_21765 [Caulobacter sp. FWC2]
MSKGSILGVLIVGVAALGALVYAAATSYWRPVMPSVTIDAEGRAALGGSRQLLIVYGERGADPMHSGPLAPDERISGCTFANGACVSQAARHELRLDGPRKQSLQIRRIGAPGNPIVATVVWSGPAYPALVRLACDFRRPRLEQACAKVS